MPLYLVAPHSLGIGYLRELDAQDNWSDPGSYKKGEDLSGHSWDENLRAHPLPWSLQHCGHASDSPRLLDPRGSHSTWSVILLLGRFHISHSLQPTGLHASGRHGNRQGKPEVEHKAALTLHSPFASCT